MSRSRTQDADGAHEKGSVGSALHERGLLYPNRSMEVGVAALPGQRQQPLVEPAAQLDEFGTVLTLAGGGLPR